MGSLKQSPFTQRHTLATCESAYPLARSFHTALQLAAAASPLTGGPFALGHGLVKPVPWSLVQCAARLRCVGGSESVRWAIVPASVAVASVRECECVGECKRETRGVSRLSSCVTRMRECVEEKESAGGGLRRGVLCVCVWKTQVKSRSPPPLASRSAIGPLVICPHATSEWLPPRTSSPSANTTVQLQE